MIAYAKTSHPNGTCEHQLTSDGEHKIKYQEQWLLVATNVSLESFRYNIKVFLVEHGFTVDNYRELGYTKSKNMEGTK